MLDDFNLGHCQGVCLFHILLDYGFLAGGGSCYSCLKYKVQNLNLPLDLHSKGVC